MNLESIDLQRVKYAVDLYNFVIKQGKKYHIVRIYQTLRVVFQSKKMNALQASEMVII